MGRHAGFTLLEMIMVIVLIAMGLGVASFALGRGLEGVRVREAGRELTLALRAARARAISEGQPQQVAFDVHQRRYQVVGQGPKALPAGMGLELTTAAQLRTGQQAAIRFHPDGSSSGGSVRLSHEGRAWQVDVAWLTGNVRWHEVHP